MKIFEGPQVPTPFGKITLPSLETPPIKMPAKPNERDKKVIAQGLGEDLAGIIGIIPWIGDIIGDAISDIHHAEIKKLLTAEEYDKFANFNKGLPTTLALARTLLFKEVKDAYN